MKDWYYFDYAATTPVRPQVLKAMEPYFLTAYANPASIYQFAGESRRAVEDARKEIAEILMASPEEIYFTSGGTEADNWALRGACEAQKQKGRHLITSSIEHHAILHTCKELEKQGWEVTYLGVDADGRIALEELKAAIRPDTVCISIMAANNEIGVIEPILEVGKIAREHAILFHTDAVQAFGHIPCSVEELPVDLLSASAHKFYGPKGVGFLYIRKGTRIAPFMIGGAQEQKKRAGTLNVPGIVGMGKAAKLAAENLEEKREKTEKLRELLIQRVLSEIPYSRLNGSREHRLPGNAHFCFRFIEGESLLMLLDADRICASSGSACTSGSLEPSHVLLALGLPHEIAHGSLRLTLSEDTTEEEIHYAVDRLKAIVEKLRSISPLYEDFMRETADVSEKAKGE